MFVSCGNRLWFLGGITAPQVSLSSYRLFSIALILLFPTSLFADTLYVTLDNCLSMARAQSPSVLAARFDSLAAAGNWRTIKGGKYPQLSLSADAPNINERVDYGLRYDPDSNTDIWRRTPSGSQTWGSSVEIAQDLPWGASLNLETSLDRLRYYTELTDTTIDFVEYSLNRAIVLNQPLLQGNPVGREREIGRIAWTNAMIDHELSMRNIHYQVTQAFFGLVSAYGQLEIARKDLEQGHESENLAQRKYKAGFLPEVELLQIQVDVARRENSFRQTEASLEASMDNLRLQLGLPFDRVVEPEFNMADIGQRMYDSTKFEGERLELTREQLNLQRQRLNTRASILTERIQASLQMYYELDTRRDNFDGLSDEGDRNFGMMVRVDIPIFGFGTTSGQVQALKAGLARAKVDSESRRLQLISEWRSVIRDVELTYERIQIADAALELSQRSYDITLQRFSSGLINSRELLDAQIEFTRTRREALTARIDYELALANLERIAPTTNWALQN